MSSLDDLIGALHKDTEERQAGGKGRNAAQLLHKEKVKAGKAEPTFEEKRATLSALAKRIDKPVFRVKARALALFIDEVHCISCGDNTLQHRFLHPLVECFGWNGFNPVTTWKELSPAQEIHDLPRKTYIRKVEVPFCPLCFTHVEAPDILLGENFRVLVDEAFPLGFEGQKPRPRSEEERKTLLKDLENIKAEGGY